MKITIYLSVLAIIAFFYIQDMKFLLVTSNSMTPTITSGDVIVTCKNNYSSGSVITFRQKDELVTHRLVNKENLETKGDANSYSDPTKLDIEQIIGKVCLIVPSGKVFKISRESFIHYLRKEVKQ